MPTPPTQLTPSEPRCYIYWFIGTGETALSNRGFISMVSLALLASFATGCAASHRTVVKSGEAPGSLQTATRADLITRYNQQAQTITSLNATVSTKLTAGSAYSGVIEQYHEVNGFILASRPASIRVIGQAPVVGKNIFDMVSDGKTFDIFIPSKNKFLVGQADLERPAKKPIENLRPQHLVDALLWTPLAKETQVLIEEANDPTARYYVLTSIFLPSKATRAATSTADSGWEIGQKIWFDRMDLNITRIEIFHPEGKVNSDVRYADWELAGDTRYPRRVTIYRPSDDYTLEITIQKLAINAPIAPDRFILKQPPGTELVHVGDDAGEPRPGEPKSEEPNQ